MDAGETVQAESDSGKVLSYATRVFTIVFALYAIVEVNALTLPPFRQRAIFLLFPLTLAFLIRPRTRPEGPQRPSLFGNLPNYAFALLGAGSCAYIVIEYDGLINRMGAPTSLVLLMG